VTTSGIETLDDRNVAVSGGLEYDITMEVVGSDFGLAALCMPQVIQEARIE